MASHMDSDHTVEKLNELLIDRAKTLTEEKGNMIAAGELHGEEVLCEEKVGMFLIKQLPADPLALRISLGEGNLANGDSAYLVFRGNPDDIGQLLERALSALKASHFQW